MYLKALEIQGFKSFPQKVRLSFEKDISAIVGPNGSGKSNISDAILWVMGEQSSRALRGGKMEDVIFGGTELRGQMGFAQVSLILDNVNRMFDIDASEIMITRRYYRSGESEYSVNGKSVRLKDVNELLMDTGLGRDGYSIIGQGRISEIISAKSTDRREIFEEAAGISKYRYRKEEAERKLDRTDESLVRINDKIGELELQVEPLRLQSETAKKYLILRDELRQTEISLWMETLDRLGAQSEKLMRDYQEAEASLKEQHMALEVLYANSEEFTGKMREKELAAEQVREKISALESAAGECESRRAVLETTSKNNVDTIARIRAELSEQDSRDGGIGAQILERRERIDAIVGDKEKIRAETETLLGSLADISQLSEAAGRAMADLSAAEAETREIVSREQAHLAGIASSITEIDERAEKYQKEMDTLKARLTAETSEAERRAAELAGASRKAESLKNIVNGHSIRLGTRKGKVTELETAAKSKYVELNTLDSRISMLSDMEKEYEGYSKAVKNVMREARRGSLSGIHAPVADLIRTKSKYTLALETALGGTMQNIVVDRAEDGKAVLNFLERTDGGRVTCSPISEIHGQKLSECNLESEKGFVGIASDIAEYDSRYAAIVQYMLGRTVIAESMDCAIAMARKYSHRFRIVTLNGQVMNAGGTMTGGSSSRNSGILSRAAELGTLKEKRSALYDSAMAADTAFKEAQRELEAMSYELNTASTELRGFEDEVLKMQAEANQHLALVAALEQNVEAMTSDVQTIECRKTELERERENAKKHITLLEAQLAEIRGVYEEKLGGQGKIAEENRRLSNRINELRTRAASLDAEKSATEIAMEELEALRAALSGDRVQKEQSIADAEKQNGELDEQIKACSDEIAAFAGKVAEAKRESEKLIAEKFEYEARRIKSDKDSQEKNREILEAEREFARLEQKKLSADMEEKQIVDKLWDSYELSRTAAEQVRMEIESMAKATKRVSELKRSISALGAPNLGAIEEYERVNTRYTYLTEQRDDIEKAKHELEQIIRSVTSEMKKIFAKEFELINESFKATFLELFGGGKASLELEDEENILNCGIEIRVQPPGKILKTLTLLSGGEKAFVAIALYFAILKVRPTPFCVMDEIESALDDYNVQRFADYMRMMSNRTQFIVITHRRGTMEEADVLYGVTMQEKGVSTVISIDLDEAEKKYQAG